MRGDLHDLGGRVPCEPDVVELVRCVRLCLDCAYACTASVRILGRQTDAHPSGGGAAGLAEQGSLMRHECLKMGLDPADARHNCLTKPQAIPEETLRLLPLVRRPQCQASSADAAGARLPSPGSSKTAQE